MHIAKIKEAHTSPIQKITEKQMFANRNDPFKPYSQTREEEIDPLSSSFKRHANLDNIQINKDLNDNRRHTLDNRGKNETFEQPQKYRVNKLADPGSEQPLRQSSLVGKDQVQFVGLQNPKKYTCFMNSIVQCLVATPGFVSSLTMNQPRFNSQS